MGCDGVAAGESQQQGKGDTPRCSGSYWLFEWLSLRVSTPDSPSCYSFSPPPGDLLLKSEGVFGNGGSYFTDLQFF